ncbi:EKC/KEOPS complex subunit TPRKB-like [Fopius arisanus]|uniref:EKC/KEOPS complex subunit TPRKB-like n=1 Tax=Fopius arisanus TaxID=64838 RepID=A0A9R1T3K8_9HYME|nr:PREDICTED: EKC/KEOPS complex subunit TPRKB-like [Fopius arisanus]
MEGYTLQLDPRTGKYLTLHLFTNIENSKEIRKKLQSGKLQCCVLKASMIVDPFQVVVAANKAVLRQHSGCMITRGVFTEILYAISSSTNISQSLLRFGIGDRDKNILVALLHEENEKAQLEEEILGEITGDRTLISRLGEFVDVELVKKTYKIVEEELKVSSLEDSIVSRIGSDYSVSLK